MTTLGGVRALEHAAVVYAQRAKELSALNQRRLHPLKALKLLSLYHPLCRSRAYLDAAASVTITKSVFGSSCGDPSYDGPLPSSAFLVHPLEAPFPGCLTSVFLFSSHIYLSVSRCLMAVPSDSVFSRTLRSSFRALCARHLPGALFNKFSRDVARRSVQFNMARRSVTTAPSSRAQREDALPSEVAAVAARTLAPEPTQAANTTRGCEQPSFYAQALYDFTTEDPHQLSMRKGDLMRIVKTEETGWWAATHASDTRVGWIPKDFVRPLRPPRRPTDRT